MGKTVSFLRAPDAGNPHVRCDEREEETEPRQTGLRRRDESLANRHRETKVTAPLLDSTGTPNPRKITRCFSTNCTYSYRLNHCPGLSSRNQNALRE